MCIRKFFDDFIKDNPTLENNDLVVRKDNKKYIVKINKDGMYVYYEEKENNNNLQLVISTLPYRKKEYLCVYNKEENIIYPVAYFSNNRRKELFLKALKGSVRK